MVNKRERLILNEAATIVSQGSYQVREANIEYLEELREALDLNMGEIDDILDQASNWYSNHQRAGGTHEFNRSDYFRIKDLLEVEYLRNLVGVGENEVSRGLNNSRGWYEEQLQGGFKIDDYNRVMVFLLTAAVLQNKEDVLDNSDLNRLVELGIIEEDVLHRVQNSADIDYGH